MDITGNLLTFELTVLNIGGILFVAAILIAIIANLVSRTGELEKEISSLEHEEVMLKQQLMTARTDLVTEERKVACLHEDNETLKNHILKMNIDAQEQLKVKRYWQTQCNKARSQLKLQPLDGPKKQKGKKVD